MCAIQLSGDVSGKIKPVRSVVAKIREHTAGHVSCPACDGLRMQFTEKVSPTLLFPEAFEQWIGQTVIRKFGHTTNAQYISSKTETDYRQYASALGKMFDSLRLEEIHDGHIREYHRARAFCDGAWAKPAGANLIRKEVQMLIRILKVAGSWTEKDEQRFQPLQQVHSDVQRAANVDEERHLLMVANSREEWKYIRNYAIVALQTTMSTNEIRNLRIGDVSLRQGIVQVRVKGAKNRFRIRSIPIETKECVCGRLKA